jgi:hypothetical protein
MIQGTQNLSQGLSQTQPKIEGNARVYKEFGCSSTPAPTPPVSVSDDWNSVVGAGISNNQVNAGAGVSVLEVKEETKAYSEQQHREKPPCMSLTGPAGFFTLFPEGMTPSGSLFLKPYFRRQDMEDRRMKDRRTQDYLLTEEQVAKMARVPLNTIRYWRQVGKLPSVKVGKHPMVWHSVFLNVFKKPLPFPPFGDDKIDDAGDIRRAL